MGRIAHFVAGPRTKWVVIALWLVLVAIATPLAGKVSDITDDRQESFLPADAESTKVLKLQKQELPGGQTANALIVYHHPGGLTAKDRAKIASDSRAAAAKLPIAGKAGAPRTLSAPSDDSLAYTILSVPNVDPQKVVDYGVNLRDITGKGANGLKVYVTGQLGFNADFQEVFGSLDTKLLIVTVLLVLVLLGAIYRAPLVAIAPILVVGLAYMVAQAGVYLYGKSGSTVNQNGLQILVVLMFGVGTDYCLLLVSRYREELRAHQDKHEAMQIALQRVGPAIVASGLTVVAAMLVLLVAKSGDVRSLGPVAAIGIAAAFIAGVTLLPALLTVFGRAGFWPRRAAVEFDPGATFHERAGIWRRLGDAVVRRPVPALVATVLLVGGGAFGLLAYKNDFSTANAFKKKTESAEGFKVLSSAFPAGALSPLTVLVQRDDGPVRPQDVKAAQDGLKGAPGVARVDDPSGASKDRSVVQFGVTLDTDPFSTAAIDRVPGYRARVAGIGPGVHALVGGETATNYDYEQATQRDIKLIVPLALLVIAVILGVLLRALLAPVVLIATVIISFLGTLGLAVLFIRYVVGDPGIGSALPTYAFIFLVALGTDYTIFLMSRVREEARLRGTREGVLRALGATGSVITSAGIILAGTFSVLLTLPVTFIFDIGFIVAAGILLDTFVVRTIMVPAAVELIGDHIWWPSTARGGGALRERTDPDATPEAERG
ncbi:MAG: putative drug exporter of the superfamily [Thermoleophilaceae bacterium]|nr:putative drug exporter of the superfamily [Thermoleophilaceae bacterium]